MHIPDGFLDARTCAGTLCLAAAGLACTARRVTAQWTDRTVPMLGVMAAFVFAGQMVNFPIPGGTSGHLAGGVLAAVLLGPAAASMALTTVLAVQCLLFQDGGITAFGANVVNLALIGVWGGHAVRRVLRRCWRTEVGGLVAAGVAAWASVMMAAAGCSIALATAGVAPLRLVAVTMLTTHAVIGVGEAVITTGVLGFVVKVRPDLVQESGPASPSTTSLKTILVSGLLAAAGVAVLLAPLASSFPDGLESAAARLGFAERARTVLAGPMPGYSLGSIPGAWWSTTVAALMGVAASFGLAWLGAWMVARRLSRPTLRGPGA